jgi:hypothetical protein
MLTVLLVTTAVIVGTFVVGLAGVWKRRTIKPEAALRESSESSDSSPWFFERPNRWIAVKCSNILKVQAALGLHNPTPCPLHEGFARLQERKLFISPPVKGWILVMGNSLPDAADDVDKLYHFLMKVAHELGSVQYFSANRALSHHSWVRIENERVYRAYAWTGETVWNQGHRTAAENELELKCYDYGDAPLPFPFAARDSHVANTDKVMQLAARWSVDPMVVANHKAALGITGELSSRR